MIDPLFLHQGESPSIVLVSQPLTGENYPAWAHLVQKTLLAESKLGFVDGTSTLSSPLVTSS